MTYFCLNKAKLEIKLAVVGGRDFKDWSLLEDKLNKLLDFYPHAKFVIVSGGAIGADSLAETYANTYFLEVKVFKPDYDKYGKAAPFVRNGEIVDHSNAVLAFWDGKSKGTLDTISKANKKGIPVWIVNY